MTAGGTDAQDGATRVEAGRSGHHTGEPVHQLEPGAGPQAGGTERENKAKARVRQERHPGCRT